jgi:predicted transcriptional regulator
LVRPLAAVGVRLAVPFFGIIEAWKMGYDKPYPYNSLSRAKALLPWELVRSRRVIFEGCCVTLHLEGNPMRSAITIDLSPELKERLERYAKETSQDPSTVASSALASFLDDEEAHLADIRAGLEDIESGRVIPHEKVSRWVDRLGTEHELSPPKCD